LGQPRAAAGVVAAHDPQAPADRHEDGVAGVTLTDHHLVASEAHQLRLTGQALKSGLVEGPEQLGSAQGVHHPPAITCAPVSPAVPARCKSWRASVRRRQ
jgi:hypothetical protein